MIQMLTAGFTMIRAFYEPLLNRTTEYSQGGRQSHHRVTKQHLLLGCAGTGLFGLNVSSWFERE